MEDKVFLGIAPVTIANRYRDILAKKDVKVDLIFNKSTCKTGCSTTMELWCNNADLEVIKEFVKNEQARNFAGLEFDPEIVNQVYDPENEEATCPACATVFSTKLHECPDCGLHFA